MAKAFKFDQLISSTPQNNDLNFFSDVAADINSQITKDIDINLIDIIEDQPFRAYGENELNELAQSIKENGLLSPLVVNKNGNRYTVLAGRNRYAACKSINMTKIPCVILNVDQTKADLILVESNLNQRQKLLPSEKAYAYKLRLECICKLQNTSLRGSMEELSQREDVTVRNMYRYIKLANLNPELLTHVDDGKITMTAGVLLTDFNYQDVLAEYLNNNNKKINENLAASLVELQKSKEINYDSLDSFFNYKPVKERKIIKVDYSRINSIIDNSNNMSDEELEDFIVNAIDYYRQNHER